ncbi:hypothetical protein Nepgr_024875 [Nepenthes gracilis]|uniref:Uncharacterized protein n=1 Tax=Nepenthes gracilis TaxID=150966 RepID=A0AAD3T5C7_NEPGR|nr:hypothetical protein Nepgr_024875 [Nepenthes gracilis]
MGGWQVKWLQVGGVICLQQLHCSAHHGSHYTNRLADSVIKGLFVCVAKFAIGNFMAVAAVSLLFFKVLVLGFHGCRLWSTKLKSEAKCNSVVLPVTTSSELNTIAVNFLVASVRAEFLKLIAPVVSTPAESTKGHFRVHHPSSFYACRIFYGGVLSIGRLQLDLLQVWLSAPNVQPNVPPQAASSAPNLKPSITPQASLGVVAAHNLLANWLLFLEQEVQCLASYYIRPEVIEALLARAIVAMEGVSAAKDSARESELTLRRAIATEGELGRPHRPSFVLRSLECGSEQRRLALSLLGTMKMAVKFFDN